MEALYGRGNPLPWVAVCRSAPYSTVTWKDYQIVQPNNYCGSTFLQPWTKVVCLQLGRADFVVNGYFFIWWIVQTSYALTSGNRIMSCKTTHIFIHCGNKSPELSLNHFSRDLLKWPKEKKIMFIYTSLTTLHHNHFHQLNNYFTQKLYITKLLLRWTILSFWCWQTQYM